MSSTDIVPLAGTNLSPSPTQVKQEGCVVLRTGIRQEHSLRSAMDRIASSLGTPVAARSRRMLPRLVPRRERDASQSSLSAKYGLGEFPYHVDTAHWPVPVRLVILACLNEGSVGVPTLLLDRRHIRLSEPETNLARTAVFYVRNGRHSFYATILGLDDRFVRYDPGCMEPVTPEAEQALLLYSADEVATHARQIAWSAGDIALIDNWNVLHARGAVTDQSLDRVILRVLVS